MYTVSGTVFGNVTKSIVGVVSLTFIVSLWKMLIFNGIATKPLGKSKMVTCELKKSNKNT